MLFEKFKNKMPSNDQLCKKVAEKVLVGKNKDYIKRDFSNILDLMQDKIYEEYLKAQEKIGQETIDDCLKNTDRIEYNELDKFFLSISQSRKSRAGSAFEFIIREMLIRLEYPFSEQVVIGGAKPDYVLPSKQYFLEKPLDSILLTAKRTLRERWRQIVTEANKAYGYFLATIDKKVSQNQIKQASEHKVYIVVPISIKQSIEHYNTAYNVISFENFFENHLDPAMKRWKL